MHERIHFISHQGKKILLIDFSNCSAPEVEKIARAAPETVTAQPRGSVLVLADFTGASFDHEALRAMKESAVFHKPYISKSAWVGAENLPPVFSDMAGQGPSLIRNHGLGFIRAAAHRSARANRLDDVKVGLSRLHEDVDAFRTKEGCRIHLIILVIITAARCTPPINVVADDGVAR